MKHIFIFLMLFPVLSYGQTLEDAVRYSRTSYYSTARTMGVGGAFGAMGGDFGAISYNPAALGNYWRSEFNVSFGLNKGYCKTDFGKKYKTDFDDLFSFENIGFVTTTRRRKGKWKSKSFAIGMNRLATFNSEMGASGNNPGSIIEDSRLVSGVDYEPWEDVGINKTMRTNESGSINELLIALGGNYNKKFIFGVSLGIPFLSYYTDRTYSELAPEELQNDDDFYFRSVDYIESYSTVGTGFNIKAGVVYLLPAGMRLGMAVHSPTYYSMKDDYEINFDVDSRNYEFTPLESDGYFNYSFKTPWEFIGSFGKLIKKGDINGFLNMDIEYVGYSSARYNFRKYSSDAYDRENEKIQNQKINENLKSAVNLRVGGELAYKKLRLRLGAGLLDTPFSDGGYQPDLTYSFGLGYRTNSYYVDFAFLSSGYTYSHFPYVADKEERSPSVEIEKHKAKFTVTTGFKF